LTTFPIAHGTVARVRRLLVVVFALLMVPAPASAARLETIRLPSHNVDAATANFNPGGALKAKVMLPDGYRRRHAYPLLLLLHGAGDTYKSWADADRGDIRRTAAGLGAIVVMPDGATGFYSNWFNGGRRGDPAWESYFLDEVLPRIRKRYRIRAGRRWHAIAGLSMGGFGATFLGGRAPGYFGSVSSFSGFVDHQRPEVYSGGLQLVSRVDYRTIFGPPDGAYATGHNPVRLVENLAESRLYVATGDGVVDPAVGSSSPEAAVGGGVVELEIRQQNDAFAAAARAAGIPLEYVPHAGIHDWPYWRNDLRGAIAHGLFAPVAARPRRWTNTTVARRGELFGLRYALARAPDGLVRFERKGRRVVITGPAIGARITTPGGCVRRGTIPMRVHLRARPCARLRLRVRPRRLRSGRRVTLRVRTGMPGAMVHAGGRSARADDAGVALLHTRFATLRRARVSATHPDRLPGATRVLVGPAG
jgi:S-formylglutathione hydrolase FrmB